MSIQLYILVKNNKTSGDPTPLPTRYKNMSGFNLDPANAKLHGWFPAEVSTDPIPSNNRRGDRIDDIINDTVHISWEMVPLLQGEINAIEDIAHKEEGLRIDSELSIHFMDFMFDFYDFFPDVFNKKSEEFKTLYNSRKTHKGEPIGPPLPIIPPEPSLSTLSAVQAVIDISTIDSTPKGMTFKSGGKHVYIVGSGNDAIYDIELDLEYDLSGGFTLKKTRSINLLETSPGAIAFDNDGSLMTVIGSQNDSAYSHPLSPNYFISTTPDAWVTMSIAEESSPQGFVYSDVGDKMFVTGFGSGAIHEYHLSTNFGILTKSAVKVTVSFLTEDKYPMAIVFSKSGKLLLMLGFETKSVFEYHLETGFDLSTISEVKNTRSFSSDISTPECLALSEDMGKLFILDSADSTLLEYHF